jgi:hypothetical protein
MLASMELLAGGAILVAIFATLFFLGRRIARGGRGTYLSAGAALLLIALTAAPDIWDFYVVGAVALASGVQTGAQRGLGARVSEVAWVQRANAYGRAHPFRTVVLPLAGLMALDRWITGRWSPAEAVLGAVELAAMLALARSPLRQPSSTRSMLGSAPVLGAICLALSGVYDRPFTPWRAAATDPAELLIFPVVTLAFAVIGWIEIRRKDQPPALGTPSAP